MMAFWDTCHNFGEGDIKINLAQKFFISKRSGRQFSNQIVLLFASNLEQRTHCTYFLPFKQVSVPSNFDGTERYDFSSRFLLLHSPFLFPPKKRGKRKGE